MYAYPLVLFSSHLSPGELTKKSHGRTSRGLGDLEDSRDWYEQEGVRLPEKKSMPFFACHLIAVKSGMILVVA